MATAFADGVLDQGLDVVRIGLASTDQLYFASGLLDCPGAMFTASHNPAAYNGIKLCRAGAKPVGKDTGLSVISKEMIAGVPAYDGARGSLSDRDVLTEYGEFLRSLVSLEGLRPLKVAVDAGNGMAGHTTPRCWARFLRSRWRRCTSNSTARFPTTRPTRWTPPTSWTCRSSSPRPVRTSGWRSTATPTGVSSSTSWGIRSRRQR